MVNKLVLLSIVVFAVVVFALAYCGVGIKAFAEEANVSAQFEQAEEYEDAGKYEQAEAIYKAIVQDYPGSDEALRAQEKLTVLYISWDKEGEGEAAFQGLLASFWDHEGIAKAVDDVADAYRESEKYEKALELYKQVINNWPEAEHAIRWQAAIAKLYIKIGDDPNAQAAIDKLIANFSGHKDVADELDSVGDEYREVKEYDKALQVYKHVVDTWPESEQACGSLASIAKLHIEVGDDANCQAAIDRLIADFSDNNDLVIAVEDIGEEYFDSGKYEKALALYKLAVDSWPEREHTIWAQVGIVKSYIGMGDDPNAQAAIDKLVTKFSGNPDLPEALYEIADSYENKERYEEAKSFYEQLIKLDPNSSEAQKAELDIQRQQILLLIKDGNDTAALEAVDRLIVDFNERPELPRTISSIEKAYYIRIAADYPLREDFLNAVKVWEKANTKIPDFFHDDPDLYYFIGDCYRHLGEYENAIQHYGIVAANWTVNGYAMVSHVVVPKGDDGPGDYEAIHALFDRLVVNFGKDAGLAATILRTGYEYRRRANDARREGLSSEAEVDNIKAIALYDRVINEFGSSSFAASGYFFSALSFRDLGRWQDALDCCNRLLDNWPEYKYASWAQRLVQDCSERLAAQLQ